MKKISTLSSQEVAGALASAEAHMSRADVRPSLAAILRAMASLNLCSPKSAGSEKSLVRRALELGLQLPPNVEFAAAAVVREFRSRPPQPQLMVSMRALNRVEVTGSDAVAIYANGQKVRVGAFDERRLRSNCDLIELNA